MPNLTFVFASGGLSGPVEYISAWGSDDPAALQQGVNQKIAEQNMSSFYGITFVVGDGGEPQGELFINKNYSGEWRAADWGNDVSWDIPSETIVNEDAQVEITLTIPDEVMAIIAECTYASFWAASSMAVMVFGSMYSYVDGMGTHYKIPYGFAEQAASNFWLHQTNSSGPIILDSSVTVPSPFPGYNDGATFVPLSWGDAPDPELFWTNRVLCKEWF